MQTPIGAFCIFDLVRIRTGVGSGEHLVSRGGRNGKTVGDQFLLAVIRSRKMKYSCGVSQRFAVLLGEQNYYATIAVN